MKETYPRHNHDINWQFENDCIEYESNKKLYKYISIDANRFKVIVNRKFIGRSLSLSECVLMRDSAINENKFNVPQS